MQPQKTTIDGFTFELMQLPAWQHTEASLQLVQILGPAITPMAKLLGKLGKAEALDLEVIGAIIQVLRFAKVPDVMALARTMLEGGGCIIGGDLGAQKKLSPLMPIFDQVLRGKLMTIYKLIAWALVVNFSGFFDDLKNALPAPALPPVAESSSASSSPIQSEEGGPAVA